RCLPSSSLFPYTTLFRSFCSQYCGTDHSKMIGWVYVMEPAEHAKWLAGQPTPDSLVAAGERAFRTRGCSGCHAPSAAIRAPLLRSEEHTSELQSLRHSVC